MGYVKWSCEQIDEFVELMFDENFFLFPPALWNPTAGILVTMYKNSVKEVVPEVHVNLSMTPEVVRKRYLGSGDPDAPWTEDVLAEDGPGTIHLYGCGPDFASDTAEARSRLEKQVRSVITEGAELGQWFALPQEPAADMLDFEQVVEAVCADMLLIKHAEE